MRGVIAYPWPFLDHWNPIALYPLIVLPSPHTRLALMVPPPLFVYRAWVCVAWCVWFVARVVSCASLISHAVPQTAARETPFEETFSRLGPGLEFTVSLPKSGFFFGEKVSCRVVLCAVVRGCVCGAR
jgi:hypothetical protein